MFLLKLGYMAACLLGLVQADIKIWQKNTNFDDPSNWNGGGILCSNDRKIFPSDMRASVYIQKNESLQELVLSNNMILVFEPGATLSFTQKPEVVSHPKNTATSSPASTSSTTSRPEQDSCIPKGRELSFVVKASSWFDPSSWKAAEPKRNDSRQLILDLEQVPCRKDAALFPPTDSFQVNMENQELRIGSINIRNNKMVSEVEFQRYWKQEMASYDFINRTGQVVVTGDVCSSTGYCDCPERYSNELKSLVCKYLKSDKNMTEICKVPIMPAYGHCSELCGANLALHFNGTDIMTDLSLIWNDLHSAILQGLKDWPDVLYNIGPYRDGKAEIIFSDDSKGSTASQSLCAVRESLGKNASSLGIVELTFVRSDGVDNCNPPPTQVPQISGNKFDYAILAIALSVGILFIVLVVVAFIIYRRKYQTNMKTELELGDINNGNRLSTQGFDNPVYDTPLPFDDNFVITYETDTDQIHGFENATYDPEGTTPRAVKKKPLPPSDPVVEKKSKKEKKRDKTVGFDNPVYDIKEKDGVDSMVSVPLDEEGDIAVPTHVEHDGTGFANPIATGLSESMMKSEKPKDASSPPAKHKISSQKSKGFENPLYSDPDPEDKDGAKEGANEEIKIQTATQQKKKKNKKKKSKGRERLEDDPEDGDAGFGNPLYEADDPKDLYQPTGPKFGDEDEGEIIPPEL